MTTPKPSDSRYRHLTSTESNLRIDLAEELNALTERITKLERAQPNPNVVDHPADCTCPEPPRLHDLVSGQDLVASPDPLASIKITPHYLNRIAATIKRTAARHEEFARLSPHADTKHHHQSAAGILHTIAHAITSPDNE